MKYNEDIGKYVWHMCFGSFCVGAFFVSLLLVVNGFETGLLLTVAAFLGAAFNFIAALGCANKLDLEEEKK